MKNKKNKKQDIVETKQEIDPIDIVDEKNIFNFILRFVKGIIIGIGAILPGLSGGVLAVIFGIYEPAIKFLSNMKHKFLKNVLFFLPAGLGLLTGVFLFSAVVEKAFIYYLASFACLFIGFVVGTLPSIYKTAGKKGRNKSDIITMIVVGLIIGLVMILGQKFALNIKESTIVWILAGGILALGFILPGLSAPNFLVYFGLYDKMAGGIKTLNMSIIIPIAIGVIATILLLAKLIDILLKKHYSKIHHTILGLVVGSSIAIFPTVIIPDFAKKAHEMDEKGFIITVIVSILLFIVGAVITYFFGRLEQKKVEEKD